MARAGAITAPTAAEEERAAYLKQVIGTSQGRQRVEIAACGIDEENQIIGSDPYGGLSSVGLRIPTLPSTAGDTRSRYLMNLVTLTLPEGRRLRLLGYRQLLTIGLIQGTPASPPGPRVIELDVTDPFFRFTNGNVSWHLRQMGLTEPFQPIRPGNARNMSLTVGGTPAPLQNLAWKMSDTPALLFQSITTPTGDPFYVDLTAYQAPNAGRPWGRDLSGLGTFHDLRTQWRQANAWTSLDIPVEGPTRIQFAASVFQTNPQGRAVITPPVADPTGSSLSREERFILNYPTAIYWRIGGSLIVEFDDPND